MVTFVLFVIAIAANWTTPRRWLLLLSVALFVVGGLMAGLLVEPEFASMVAAGYSDTIDPVLQSRAARWLVLDWAVWTMGLAAGLVLLIALLRPATTEKPTLDLDTAQS